MWLTSFQSYLPRTALGAGLLAVAMSSAILANLFFYMIIGEINRKLPETERFSYLFGYGAKYLRILGAYRRLYPAGRLHIVLGVLIVLTLICVVLTGCTLGIIHLPRG